MTPMITLSILVEDESGVLSRITNLFHRRGFRLESLTIGPSELDGVVRIVLIIEGDVSTCLQITKQLYKILNVVDIRDFTNVSSVQRELLLVKVLIQEHKQVQLTQIIKAVKARIVDISESFLTLEITGEPDKILAARKLMKMFEVIEYASSGRACLFRESDLGKKN